MSNWTLTASEKTPPANHSSDIYTNEAMLAALDRGLEQVFKREFKEPAAGEQFVRFIKSKFTSGKVATFRGWGGVVPENRDADQIPYATKGEGFTWEWATRNFRRGIKVERTAIETDDIGSTAGGQADLANMFKRTVEYTIADQFNRALGTAGSQLLAEDGMYMIDSARPNPNAAAGDWTNLESQAVLSDSTLFTAYYNAENQVSEDGNLYPQMIRKIVLPTARRHDMWTLLNTTKVLGNNNNDANWAASMFKMEDVIFYPYMTTDQILYLLCDPKSTDNELVMVKRVEPTVRSGWGEAANPDVMYQSLRASFGLGLGSPRKFIRGGLLSAGT